MKANKLGFGYPVPTLGGIEQIGNCWIQIEKAVNGDGRKGHKKKNL